MSKAEVSRMAANLVMKTRSLADALKRGARVEEDRDRFRALASDARRAASSADAAVKASQRGDYLQVRRAARAVIRQLPKVRTRIIGDFIDGKLDTAQGAAETLLQVAQEADKEAA